MQYKKTRRRAIHVGPNSHNNSLTTLNNTAALTARSGFSVAVRYVAIIAIGCDTVISAATDYLGLAYSPSMPRSLSYLLSVFLVLILLKPTTTFILAVIKPALIATLLLDRELVIDAMNIADRLRYLNCTINLRLVVNEATKLNLALARHHGDVKALDAGICQ